MRFFKRLKQAANPREIAKDIKWEARETYKDIKHIKNVITRKLRIKKV